MLNRRGLGLVALVLIALVCTGCLWARQRVNNPNVFHLTDKVAVGKTTDQQLMNIMGTPPVAILPAGEGKEIFLYNFGDVKTKGLTLIIFNVKKTNAGFDSAYFLIGKDKVVERKMVSDNSQDLPWEWWAFAD